jgi:hypothetical protein
MNRSYSKIRHIQEANLMLERRMMSEKRMIYEIEMKDGEILVTARPQEDVDKGVTSVSFQIMNDVLGQTPYYYKCAAEKDSTPAQQVDHEKPGAMYDGNLKLVSAASLGLIDGWKDKLRVGCKPVYDHLANWRKTFCPDLKNKTKPYYDWNCPKAAEPVAAAAETAPVAPAGMSPEQIAAKKAEEVKKDQKMLEDLTNFENLRLFFLDKEDGTLKTDQELEADVKTWNDYLTGQGKDEYSIGQGGNLTVGELSQRAAKYLRGRIASFMKMKPTLTRPNGGYKVIKTGAPGES